MSKISAWKILNLGTISAILVSEFVLPDVAKLTDVILPSYVFGKFNIFVFKKKNNLQHQKKQKVYNFFYLYILSCTKEILVYKNMVKLMPLLV